MIDLVQNTIDGVMIGSSYGLLALGFTVIFGVMRRLNLSYGPSIMIGGLSRHAALSAALAPARSRWRGARRARRGARRHLCRAALLRADGGRRRHRLDGVELRDLDAARAGGDPGPAAPHLSVPAARDRRAARASGRSSLRIDHLIMLVCALALVGGRASCALPHPLRAGAARHHRQSGCRASGRDRRAARRAAGLRGRLGDRRHRRLSGARGRPAGHADVRHVGDVEGPDRHDDRRARIDPRRGRRRIAARRRGGAQPMVFRPADSRSRSPIWCCSRFWWLRPGGLLGARARDARRRRKA